jgi:hypothetical protein
MFRCVRAQRVRRQNAYATFGPVPAKGARPTEPGNCPARSTVVAQKAAPEHVLAGIGNGSRERRMDLGDA